MKQSLIIALVLSIISISGWELYWRTQGKMPDLDDDKNVWAEQRAKVEGAAENEIVLIGSSRVLFDIQLDEWEAQTGSRPIQLATAGGSPLPLFHDLVNNTDFTGTILVGVTPGLFFSTTFPGASPWKRPQSRVDYFENRTYAQRLNHWLSIPLQQNLVMISTSEEGWSDDIDLKSLLNKIQLENRTGETIFPPFNNFGNFTEDRNMMMTEKAATDTAFAGSIKNVWKTPPEREATTAFFVEDAKKFKAKGGQLILLHCPSSGMFKEGETKYFPRAEFWNELVTQTTAKGYHYQDYDEFKSLDCPEWSHLSAPDAKYFTTELVKIMKADGTLSNSKIN
jgi:hypothetical protein